MTDESELNSETISSGNYQMLDEKQKMNTTSDIEIQIAENEAMLGAYRKKSQIIFALIVAITAIIVIATQATGWFISENSNIVKFLPLAGYGSAIYFIFLGLYWIALRTSRHASYEAEIETLKAKQKILSRLPENEPDDGSGAYFDQLVRINVENLAAYYSQVKAQADKSFLTAVAVGGVGFLFIVSALIIGLFGITTSATMAFISAGSGVITELIATVFFYLYSKTVRQMKEYHDSLLAVQNVLLSFKLIGDIQSEETKASMIGQMLQYLIGSHGSFAPTLNKAMDCDNK